MELTFREIIELDSTWQTFGQVPAGEVPGFSTDSRHIRTGEIFVPIKGDNFDGHSFIEAALDHGASLAIVEKEWFETNNKRYADKPLLLVPDALSAYQEIARYYRKKLDPQVVALTGSAGKTTCKELIYAVLSKKYNVLKNSKSFNNHVGVPKTLLDLNPEHEILVAELGTSGFGEIERLSYLVEPHVGLMLNIGYAHIEFLRDLPGVTRAKMEMFEHVDPNGAAIYNADDPYLRFQHYAVSEVLSFAIHSYADVRAENLSCEKHGNYSFDCAGERFSLHLPGRHNVYNALAAVATGLYFQVPLADIKDALASVDSVEHRLQVSQFNGFTLVDDAYNANPNSCRAAMNMLADMQITNGRRFVVLGDMLELGDFSEMEHRNLADVAKASFIDALFLFGTYTKFTAERATALGLRAAHFEDMASLITELKAALNEDDVVLVKGSRSMRMERVVTALHS